MYQAIYTLVPGEIGCRLNCQMGGKSDLYRAGVSKGAGATSAHSQGAVQSNACAADLQNVVLQIYFQICKIYFQQHKMLFFKMQLQMQKVVLQIYFLSCAFFPNSPNSSAISFLHSFMFTYSFVIFCWTKKGMVSKSKNVHQGG